MDNVADAAAVTANAEEVKEEMNGAGDGDSGSDGGGDSDGGDAPADLSLGMNLEGLSKTALKKLKRKEIKQALDKEARRPSGPLDARGDTKHCCDCVASERIAQKVQRGKTIACSRLTALLSRRRQQKKARRKEKSKQDKNERWEKRKEVCAQSTSQASSRAAGGTDCQLALCDANEALYLPPWSASIPYQELSAMTPEEKVAHDAAKAARIVRHHRLQPLTASSPDIKRPSAKTAPPIHPDEAPLAAG